MQRNEIVEYAWNPRHGTQYHTQARQFRRCILYMCTCIYVMLPKCAYYYCFGYCMYICIYNITTDTVTATVTVVQYVLHIFRCALDVLYRICSNIRVTCHERHDTTCRYDRCLQISAPRRPRIVHSVSWVPRQFISF